MPNWLLRWLVTALTIFAIPHVLSGVQVSGFGSALAASALISVLNFLVRPLMIILTLPLTILSLGFFILVINALIFQWASNLVSGFQVDSFGSAFLAALLVSLVSWVMNLSYRSHGGRRTISIKRFRRGDTLDLQRNGDGGDRWEL